MLHRPSLGVCDGTTPYDMAIYGVAPSQTPNLGSAQPMGFSLFKVDGKA